MIRRHWRPAGRGLSQGPFVGREPGAGRAWLARLRHGVHCTLLLTLGGGGLHAQEIIELPGADRTLSLELTELYTIGGLNVEPWEEFQAVNDAAFGIDGRLYLLDAPGHTVLAVSQEGKLLHRVGQQGEGPGEHKSASGLAVLPDGRLVIWDFGKRVFLLFDADGNPLGQVRPDFSAGMPDDPFAVTDDGHLLGFPLRITSSAGGISYLSSKGLLTAQEGLPILEVPLDDGAPVEVFALAGLQRWSGPGDPPIHRAFQPWPSWGSVTGGVAIHQAEGYRIDLVARNGTVERALTRPLEPREVTPADRTAYARDLRRRYEDGEIFTAGPGAGGTVAARVRSELDETWYYPRISPILEITANGRDKVWVQRRHAGDPTQPGPVDVLTTNGGYLGTLPAGNRGLPVAFGPEGLVVFVVEGEFDVPQVQVFRLPPGLR